MSAPVRVPEAELANSTGTLHDRFRIKLVGMRANGVISGEQHSALLDLLEQDLETILECNSFTGVIQALNDRLTEMFPTQPEIVREVVVDSTSVLVAQALHAGPEFSKRVLDAVLVASERDSVMRFLDIDTATEHGPSALALDPMPPAFANDPTIDALFETTGVGVVLNSPDGTIARVNQRLLDILGLQAETVVGTPGTSLLRDVYGLSKSQLDLIGNYARSKTQRMTLESVVKRPDGSNIWVSTESSIVLDDNDQPRYFLNIVDDITASKTAFRVHQNSEERIHALFQHSSDVIAIIARSGEVDYVSESVERILGFDPGMLIGRNVLDLVADEFRTALDDVFTGVLESPRLTAQATGRLIHANGSWRWMEIDFNNLSDVPSVGGVVFTARDVTKRKSFEQQLERLAYFDALTALPNRMHFCERLDAALSASNVSGKPVAIVFIDLDRFKAINDRYGHDGGDSALVAVSQRILDSLHAGELVARLGGDEFAILIENASRRGAQQTADRVLAALKSRFPDAHRFITVDASAGIALSSPSLNQPTELLRAADIALYQGKALGGGTATLFRPDMFDNALWRADLERDLQLALSREEMTPYFQPEFDLASGNITSLEVLMRWERPSGLITAPDYFLETASELGIIVPLGLQILRIACGHMARWIADGTTSRPVPISLNVSAREVLLPDYPERIAELLQQTGLSPSLLGIELDDHVFRDSSPELDRFVTGLDAIGVEFVVGDFGGGYASWKQLHRLKTAKVKMARNLTGSPNLSDVDLEILASVRSLATRYGILVTATGLDSQEMVDRARLAGCDRGQGFFFAPPLDAGSLATLLATT